MWPGRKSARTSDPEKRKAQSSKEGKLGVEGMKPEVLAKALIDAGATVLDAEETCSPRRAAGITKQDLFELGLSGRRNSSERRAALLLALDLPARMSANAMLEAVNLLMTKQELANVVASLPAPAEDSE